jgi:hypothetical protein
MTATDAVIQAMAWQANFMCEGMKAQVLDMFPMEGDPLLTVTGFVFRPVDDDDLDPDEEPDPGEVLYAFEAHFHAFGHPSVGNLTTTLIVNLPDTASYEEARATFVRLVREARDKTEKRSLQERIDAHWGEHPEWPAEAAGCDKGCTPQRQGVGVGCQGNECGESCHRFWLKGDPGGAEVLAFMDARDRWEKEHRALEKEAAEAGEKVAL